MVNRAEWHPQYTGPVSPGTLGLHKRGNRHGPTKLVCRHALAMPTLELPAMCARCCAAAADRCARLPGCCRAPACMRRGIAFITFATQQAADSALEYDGEQVEGQTLKVRRAAACCMLPFFRYLGDRNITGWPHTIT
jgi:hypothetical protein